MIHILGLAGSGKSTQGQLLATRLNCPWISVGKILRERAKGKARQDMMDGKIVSDDVSLALLEEDLKEKQADKLECVIDGFPRTLNQARWLVDKIKRREIKVTGVVHLKAHKPIALERLLHRGRTDDTEEAINQRFKDYELSILPILDYLKSEGIKIFEVNADLDIDEVERQIDVLLGLE